MAKKVLQFRSQDERWERSLEGEGEDSGDSDRDSAWADPEATGTDQYAWEDDQRQFLRFELALIVCQAFKRAFVLYVDQGQVGHPDAAISYKLFRLE